MVDRVANEDPKAAYLGPFRLLKRVATGGMAEVFAARVAKVGAPSGTAIGDLVALNALYRPGPLGGGLIEDFVKGTEASDMVVTDGQTLLVLEPARDYKAAYDGDHGPNTGGMGAFSPSPIEAGLQRRQGRAHGIVDCGTVVRREIGQRRVMEHPSGGVLHQEKFGADHRGVLAKPQRAHYRYRRVGQRGGDAVLAVDRVRRRQ